jgi:hypothetical protein
MEGRRDRWAGYVACMGKIKTRIKFRFENLKGTDHSGGLGVDGKKTVS